jgi:hypothetical protein
MVIHMRVTSSMVRLMVKEFIIGLMVRCMMVSGRKVSKMDTVCGEVYLVTVIWDNGLKVKPMVMVCISGKMVIDLRVHGSNA